MGENVLICNKYVIMQNTAMFLKIDLVLDLKLNRFIYAKLDMFIQNTHTQMIEHSYMKIFN